MIHTSLNQGDVTCAVFVDLRKAIDIVDHQILLSKLKCFNFSPSDTKLCFSQEAKIGHAISPPTVCDIKILTLLTTNFLLIWLFYMLCLAKTT